VTVVPGVGVLFEADTVILFRADVVTVRVAVPVIEELLVAVAVIVHVSAVEPVVSSPVLAFMVLVQPDDSDQVTDTLLEVLPSLFTPLAVICWVELITRLGLEGLMLIEVRVGLTKNP
jgi:hypothetical protein